MPVCQRLWCATWYQAVIGQPCCEKIDFEDAAVILWYCDTQTATLVSLFNQILRLSEIKFYLKSNLLVLTLVLTVFNFHNESVYVICDLHIIICNLHRPQHGNESESFFAHCGWWFSEHLDVVWIFGAVSVRRQLLWVISRIGVIKILVLLKLAPQYSLLHEICRFYSVYF